MRSGMVRHAPTWLIVLWVCLFAVTVACGQDAEATPAVEDAPLIAEAVEVVAGVGMFDQPIQTVEGRLINVSATAQGVGSIRADAFDRTDRVIGVGVGVSINACGVGLLDVTLNPGESVGFSAPLELFEGNARVARVAISADSADVTADEPPADLVPGARQLFAGEAVTVEFHDQLGMLFAAGCGRDPLWEWAWYRYPLDGRTRANSAPEAIVYPTLNETTPEALAARLRFNDEAIWRSAFVRFAPDSRRFVFQDAVNTVYTATIPGALLRPLHTRLNNRTLQDIYWLPDGRFMATYYGAFGDSVIYFTADVEGRFISNAPQQYPPSEIVPGVTADARRVIVAADFTNMNGAAGSTGTGHGYYLLVLTTGFYEKLFDADAPGNNYPNPVPVTDPVENLVTQVYVPLEVAGQARLSCFDRAAGTLTDLGALPFRLTDEERARMWLTPDGAALVIAVSGRRGGVWLLEIAMLGC